MKNGSFLVSHQHGENTLASNSHMYAVVAAAFAP